MVNPRLADDAGAFILKSKHETKKCSDLIEKHICSRQAQNLRFRDPLVGGVRFRNLGRICRDSFFRGPFTTLYLLLFLIIHLEWLA